VRELVDSILDHLLTLPDWAVYATVGGLAAVENIFPPVPADVAVGIGAFLSGHGTVAASVVFLVTWVANVSSATAVYVAGRTLGRSFFTGRLGRRLIRLKHLETIERLYDGYGSWGIFCSRFIPAARAVVPPFAGIANLSAPRTIIPLAAASAIWYGSLTVLVSATAGQIEDVVRLVSHLNWAVLALGVIAIGVLVLLWRRRGRPQGRDAPQEGTGMPDPDRDAGSPS
jgi:membrane protein DedA with SNARE-associated domain